MKRPLEDDPDMNRLDKILRGLPPDRREAFMDHLDDEIEMEDEEHGRGEQDS